MTKFEFLKVLILAENNYIINHYIIIKEHKKLSYITTLQTGFCSIVPIRLTFF